MTPVGKTWQETAHYETVVSYPIKYTWQGNTWRSVGLVLTGVLYYVGLFDDALWVAVIGWVVFFGSWSIAAWFDVHQKDVR